MHTPADRNRMFDEQARRQLDTVATLAVMGVIAFIAGMAAGWF